MQNLSLKQKKSEKNWLEASKLDCNSVDVTYKWYFRLLLYEISKKSSILTKKVVEKYKKFTYLQTKKREKKYDRVEFYIAIIIKFKNLTLTDMQIQHNLV